MKANRPLRLLSAVFLASALALSLGRAAEHRWKLPAETAKLKPGAGVELATAQCSLCHSFDYISTQPPLGRDAWLAIVQKMRDKFGAPIPTNRIDRLADYLAKVYGTEKP